MVSLGPLLRHGYTNVKQLAVLPDAALQDMRQMGVTGIGELRAAIANLGLTATPAAVPVTLTAEQVSELGKLLSALGAFADMHGELDLATRTAAFTWQLTNGPA